MKIKENEKIDKHLDLDREPKKKKLWNLRLVVVLIVDSALGSFAKNWKIWRSEQESRRFRLQHYLYQEEYLVES